MCVVLKYGGWRRLGAISGAILARLFRNYVIIEVCIGRFLELQMKF